MVNVSQILEENLVYVYLFTSQRESHSVPDMDSFAILSLILFHLELSRIELTGLKAWPFEKIIFEVDYH